MPTTKSPLKFSSALFMRSAATLPQCPPDIGSEVAFAGRSNAGKSSAINALTGKRKLTRISKTPGRTRLINFFSLSTSARLVDLPGYGFAKVSKTMKEEWDRNLADYLHHRRSLKALVLLMDIRHPLRSVDWQMLQWAAESNLPVHILLTKSDKLGHGPAMNTLQEVQKEIRRRDLDNISAQTFSAHRNTGIDELTEQLRQWLEPNETEPDDEISVG